MSRRANLQSNNLGAWLVSQVPNSTRLTTRISEGPGTIIDRYVTANLTDAEMITILAKMAAMPRWAATIAAITDDQTYLDSLRDVQHLGGGGDRHAALVARMRDAMSRYDSAEGGQS
jgi:hypothetical protein